MAHPASTYTVRYGTSHYRIIYCVPIIMCDVYYHNYYRNSITIVTPSPNFASSHHCKASELSEFRRVLRNYPISSSLRFWHFFSPSSQQQLIYIPCSSASKANGVISRSSQPTGILTLLQLLLQNISRDRSCYHMKPPLNFLSRSASTSSVRLQQKRQSSHFLSLHTASYRS